MSKPTEACIVDAKRTPIGRFCGGLSSLTAADLATQLGETMFPGVQWEGDEQVILGQVLQAGAGLNVARQVALRLKLPIQTPAYTVNMACASGLKAIALAANAVTAGESQMAIAGGVESMSRAPFYNHDLRTGRKLGDSPLVDAVVADGLSDSLLGIGMGETAERIADKFKISRTEQDEFALMSQQRAAASREVMKREIVPIRTKQGECATDEHPRADTTLEKLSALKPAFRPNGTVTAGNASGINDGAALALIASKVAVARHGLKVRARVVGSTSVGCDPALMGMGPVGAVRKLCQQLDWGLDEIEAIEINEAFAVQTLACARVLGISLERLNRRGGAIALGHPVGCSGARVLVSLLHIMEDHGFGRGIAALCVGGGQGIAMGIELVTP